MASVVALLAFDLPYRFGLPIAVFAALVAGTLADVIAEHAGAGSASERPTTRIVVKEADAKSETTESST